MEWIRKHWIIVTAVIIFLIAPVFVIYFYFPKETNKVSGDGLYSYEFIMGNYGNSTGKLNLYSNRVPYITTNRILLDSIESRGTDWQFSMDGNSLILQEKKGAQYRLNLSTGVTKYNPNINVYGLFIYGKISLPEAIISKYANQE